MDNKMQKLSMRITNAVLIPYSGLNMPQLPQARTSVSTRGFCDDRHLEDKIAEICFELDATWTDKVTKTTSCYIIWDDKIFCDISSAVQIPAFPDL